MHQTTTLIPELCCTNIKSSLNFYINVLGFTIIYQREEDNFAMLDRFDARIMLDQINKNDASLNNRTWLTGTTEPPFGNGYAPR